KILQLEAGGAGADISLNRRDRIGAVFHKKEVVVALRRVGLAPQPHCPFEELAGYVHVARSARRDRHRSLDPVAPDVLGPEQPSVRVVVRDVAVFSLPVDGLLEYHVLKTEIGPIKVARDVEVSPRVGGHTVHPFIAVAFDLPGPEQLSLRRYLDDELAAVSRVGEGRVAHDDRIDAARAVDMPVDEHIAFRVDGEQVWARIVAAPEILVGSNPPKRALRIVTHNGECIFGDGQLVGLPFSESRPSAVEAAQIRVALEVHVEGAPMLPPHGHDIVAGPADPAARANLPVGIEACEKDVTDVPRRFEWELHESIRREVERISVHSRGIDVARLIGTEPQHIAGMIEISGHRRMNGHAPEMRPIRRILVNGDSAARQHAGIPGEGEAFTAQYVSIDINSDQESTQIDWKKSNLLLKSKSAWPPPNEGSRVVKGRDEDRCALGALDHGLAEIEVFSEEVCSPNNRYTPVWRDANTVGLSRSSVNDPCRSGLGYDNGW